MDSVSFMNENVQSYYEAKKNNQHKCFFFNYHF